jgi:hypothetical protein
MIFEVAKFDCKEFALCGRPLKEPVTGPEAGEKGVAGEKGSGEVFRCVSGRCFGKKNPQSAPVNG